ncbi:MAG: hypothetical protein ACJAS1_005771 [Oleiphilaceae bacterium]
MNLSNAWRQLATINHQILTMKHPHKAQPIIIREDGRLGLILGPDKAAFCKKLIEKSDKRRTLPPHNITSRNAGTLRHIRDLGATDLEQLTQLSVKLYGECKKLYPQWRHINQQLDLTFTQMALEEIAKETNQVTYLFDINISPRLGKKILNQDGATYLNHRLQKELKYKMGRTPRLWLILEAVTKRKSNYEGKLHAHGSINLLPGEIVLFKKVMVSLNGYSMSSATKMKPVTDGYGRVDYCTKHQARNNMFLPNVVRTAKSAGLSKRAKQMYEKARTDYNSALKQQGK